MSWDPWGHWTLLGWRSLAVLELQHTSHHHQAEMWHDFHPSVDNSNSCYWNVSLQPLDYPSETIAPVALSQNDSPLPARSGTDAPTERNTEIHSPCGGVKAVDLHREHKKKWHFSIRNSLRGILLVSTPWETIRRARNSICNSWAVLLKIKLQYTIYRYSIGE